MHVFPKEVIEKLRTYVYRLIDPRNGETFYVGKGKGNRVFAHIRAEVESEDPGEKLRRIREIRAAGFEVAHVIHRHGMDEATAFEVESALIDAYPGLTNSAVGFGSDFGAMHAQEIIRKYSAYPADFKHRAVLITVNHSALEVSLYEATRYAWKMNIKKARRAEIVAAVRFGIILDVFIPSQWLPALPEHFPGREPIVGRVGFVGHDADESIKKLYVGKRIPDEYRKQGAANPIKYSYR